MCLAQNAGRDDVGDSFGMTEEQVLQAIESPGTSSDAAVSATQAVEDVKPVVPTKVTTIFDDWDDEDEEIVIVKPKE